VKRIVCLVALALGSVGLAGCHTTSARKLCTDSKPSVIVLTKHTFRGTTSSNGYAHCGGYRRDNTSIRFCWWVRASNHHVGAERC